jgi:hypothetical protein
MSNITFEHTQKKIQSSAVNQKYSSFNYPVNILRRVLRLRSERERDRKYFENLERERISFLNAFICIHLRSKKG